MARSFTFVAVDAPGQPKPLPKGPAEHLPFWFVLDCVLPEGAEIVGIATSVSPPGQLTVESIAAAGEPVPYGCSSLAPPGRSLVAWLSGGVEGAKYVLDVVVTLADGQKRQFLFPVEL